MYPTHLHEAFLIRHCQSRWLRTAKADIGEIKRSMRDPQSLQWPMGHSRMSEDTSDAYNVDYHKPLILTRFRNAHNGDPRGRPSRPGGVRRKRLEADMAAS